MKAITILVCAIMMALTLGAQDTQQMWVHKNGNVLYPANLSTTDSITFTNNELNHIKEGNPVKSIPISDIDSITFNDSWYWEDDYRRNSLVGKVKTVIEWSDDDDDYHHNTGSEVLYLYRKLPFDSKGNLKENAFYVFNDTPQLDDDLLYRGLLFQHNTENRITRCEYYNGYKLDEIAELSYEGANSHNVYIPSNIFFEDLRLQKGITDMVYKYASGTVLLEFHCISVQGNQLKFQTGGTGYLVVTTQGSYPAKIEAEGPNGEILTMATVAFNNNGIPTTLYSYMDNYETLVIDYIVKGGFLSMTSQERMDKETGEIGYPDNKYTYNERGLLATEKEIRLNITTEIIYTYEYDDTGNWTKCNKQRTETNNNGVFEYETTIFREYTYW